MVKQNEDDEEAKRSASAKLYEFDMMQAIESALDSSILPGVATHNLDAQVELDIHHFALLRMSYKILQSYNSYVICSTGTDTSKCCEETS